MNVSAPQEVLWKPPLRQAAIPFGAMFLGHFSGRLAARKNVKGYVLPYCRKKVYLCRKDFRDG
jgi:hypothetical protein